MSEQSDKPVFKLFDESRGENLKWYYFTDETTIMGPFKPAEMKHWIIATPVMMSLKVYCTEGDVPVEWALGVGTFVCAPLTELLTAAGDNVPAPVWSYQDVKEQMMSSGQSAAVIAHERKRAGDEQGASGPLDDMAAMHDAIADVHYTDQYAYPAGRGRHGRSHAGRSSPGGRGRRGGRGGRSRGRGRGRHETPNDPSWETSYGGSLGEEASNSTPVNLPTEPSSGSGVGPGSGHGNSSHTRHGSGGSGRSGGSASKHQQSGGGRFGVETDMDWNELGMDDSPMTSSVFGYSPSQDSPSPGQDGGHGERGRGRGRRRGGARGRSGLGHSAARRMDFREPAEEFAGLLDGGRSCGGRGRGPAWPTAPPATGDGTAVGFGRGGVGGRGSGMRTAHRHGDGRHDDQEESARISRHGGGVSYNGGRAHGRERADRGDNDIERGSNPKAEAMRGAFMDMRPRHDVFMHDTRSTFAAQGVRDRGPGRHRGFGGNTGLPATGAAETDAQMKTHVEGQQEAKQPHGGAGPAGAASHSVTTGGQQQEHS